MLLVLTFVPHTMLPYELVPLFLIPHRAYEILILAVATQLAHGVTQQWFAPFGTWAQLISTTGNLLVLLVYLPGLAIVLSRPNRGDVPDWLARWILRVPLPPGMLGRGSSDA
jgi:hypothetical protein